MVKVTADSTCDLSPQIINDLDITLMPLHILVDGEEFSDGVDITPEDIFKYVDEQGKTCKTAAVNVYEYKSLFEEMLSKYEAVIHVSLGSEFSSCYQNACLAAQDLKNVYVIDSRNLSTGSGHLVYEAAIMARNGLDPEEICKNLEELVPRIDASFVIDRLDYLHKGGRCSGLEAIGAKFLKIKPCIEVVEGKMIVGKKYRGSFERCLQNYIKDKLLDKEDIDYSRIFITHPMCSKQTIEKVKETISQYAQFDEIIETKAGCTISTHCGPNTLGILFKRKNNKDRFNIY